jgi:hypothetical protein
LIASARIIEEASTGGKDTEEIWTPDKDKAGDEKGAKKLWTPGSK